jgi:phosphatidate phosphatase APP1
MAWKDLIYTIGNKSETHLDKLRIKFRQRMGWHTNVQICPFMTYGSHERIYIKGRVMVNRGVDLGKDDSLWENVVNMYKRFNSLEIAGAKIKVQFNNTLAEVVSDEDGYFEIDIPLNGMLPFEELWHHPVLELLEAPVDFPKPLMNRGVVMTPPSTAQYGVISDIDDTILTTHAQSLLKSAYMTFLNNAYSRLPFEGVAAFYESLQKGISGGNYNPIFYVSSSPWNLYDLLVDFMDINKIPKGPIFLKDYGFTHKKVFSESHEIHKPKAIRNVLNAYPNLPFILVGDSGQKDPEVYAEIIKEFPGRILTAYIRDVTLDERDIQVKKISEGLAGSKVEMVLVENSYTAAKHAADKGYIDPLSLPLIKAEKKQDEAIKPTVEVLIEKEIKTGI